MFLENVVVIGDYVEYSVPQNIINVATRDISNKAMQKFDVSQTRWKVYCIRNDLVFLIADESVGDLEVESTTDNKIIECESVRKVLRQIAKMCSNRKYCFGGVSGEILPYVTSDTCRVWKIFAETGELFNPNAIISNNGKCTTYDGEYKDVYKLKAGVKPLLVLKKELKVTGGTGEINSPYQIIV